MRGGVLPQRGNLLYRRRYRPDLFHYLPFRKIIIVSNPSSRIRATVHRTVAFDGSNLSTLDFSKIKTTCRNRSFFILEVPARFELANNGFADRGLTTWLRYHMKQGTRGDVPCIFGAGDEARTRYLHLGKVALYRMSYARKFGASGRNRTNDTRTVSPLLYLLSYRGI